jgi:hypothetical protein
MMVWLERDQTNLKLKPNESLIRGGSQSGGRTETQGGVSSGFETPP